MSAATTPRLVRLAMWPTRWPILNGFIVGLLVSAPLWALLIWIVT